MNLYSQILRKNGFITNVDAFNREFGEHLTNVEEVEDLQYSLMKNDWKHYKDEFDTFGDYIEDNVKYFTSAYDYCFDEYAPTYDEDGHIKESKDWESFFDKLTESQSLKESKKEAVYRDEGGNIFKISFDEYFQPEDIYEYDEGFTASVISFTGDVPEVEGAEGIDLDKLFGEIEGTPTADELYAEYGIEDLRDINGSIIAGNAKFINFFKEKGYEIFPVTYSGSRDCIMKAEPGYEADALFVSSPAQVANGIDGNIDLYNEYYYEPKFKAKAFYMDGTEDSVAFLNSSNIEDIIAEAGFHSQGALKLIESAKQLNEFALKTSLERQNDDKTIEFFKIFVKDFENVCFSKIFNDFYELLPDDFVLPIIRNYYCNINSFEGEEIYESSSKKGKLNGINIKNYPDKNLYFTVYLNDNVEKEIYNDDSLVECLNNIEEHCDFDGVTDLSITENYGIIKIKIAFRKYSFLDYAIDV